MKKNLSSHLSQVSDYEIRLLRVFHAVVEAGGFAAAETDLNISRSTISVHISRLEERLKLKLCRRGRGGFGLTEDGQEVYRLMTELFSSIESFKSGVNALHVELTGELRVITSDVVCMAPQAKIAEAIRGFAQAAPDVKILLDVRPLSDIERMILNDEADVGFIPYHHQYEGINYWPLYTDRCHLYCGQQHPLYGKEESEELLAEVAKAKVVHAGIQPSPAVSEQLANMNKAAISYFYEARLAMLFSGMYIGFFPDNYAEPYVKSGELWRLVPNYKHYDLGIAAVTRKAGRSNRARDMFISVIQELHQCE